MTSAPVIAVVGPSGVGKDSVMRGLAEQDDGFRLVRRVITRAADAGSEDFDAVSSSVFHDRDHAGDFILSWEAHGLSYGIPNEILDLRKDARAVLVNLSRSVLLQAQDRLAPLVVVSLTADPELLARRLASRGREDMADRARRLNRAAELPEGLQTVIEVDNSGALSETVSKLLTLFQPESV